MCGNVQTDRCVLLWVLGCVVLSDKVPLQFYDIYADRPVELHFMLANFSTSLNYLHSELLEIKKLLHERLDQFEVEMNVKCPSSSVNTDAQPPVLRHCADVYKHSSKESGVYQIQPKGATIPFKVYCDMTTDGGGWTVFQRRGDNYNAPQDNFYRSWQEYKMGFGDLDKEFWLGNDKVALMTQDCECELRIDMTDVDGSSVYAKYDNFRIQNELQRYRLVLGSFSGNAGDSLSRQNGMRFSTMDRDYDANYDRHCAQEHRGAWWYSDCHDSSLNGLNLKGRHASAGKGIEWRTWKGQYYSIYRTEMKFRPKNYYEDFY